MNKQPRVNNQGLIEVEDIYEAEDIYCEDDFLLDLDEDDISMLTNTKNMDFQYKDFSNEP